MIGVLGHEGLRPVAAGERWLLACLGERCGEGEGCSEGECKGEGG